VLAQHLLVVVGREHAAVDAHRPGPGGLDRGQHLDAHRMRGGAAGVPGHHDVRAAPAHLGDDAGDAHAGRLRVEEGDAEPGVTQGTAHHQQAERHLMADAPVARDRLVRRIDQQRLHWGTPDRLRTSVRAT
jgi:hypothetical protein